MRASGAVISANIFMVKVKQLSIKMNDEISMPPLAGYGAGKNGMEFP